MVFALDRPHPPDPAAEARLRRRVPCVGRDPLTRAAYEQALRDWLEMTADEREAAGFAAAVNGTLATMF